MSNTVKNLGAPDGTTGKAAVMVSPDGTRRIVFRDGLFQVQAVKTPLGFSGAEDVDWEVISSL